MAPKDEQPRKIQKSGKKSERKKEKRNELTVSMVGVSVNVAGGERARRKRRKSAKVRRLLC